MDNILTLNQSIFGTRTKKRRISRRALKASAKELYIPQESEEISYDEGYDIDGGGSIKIGIKFTLGAVVGASVVSTIVGFLSGYACTKALKFGTMIGGFWGGAVGFLAGALISGGIAKAVNKAVYAGASGRKEITLIDISTGWFGSNFKCYYDLGNILGICIGGPTGYAGGYALGSASALVSA